MKNRIIIRFAIAVLLFTGTASCQEDWLEEKRDKALIVPTTLRDMRMLLRRESLLAKDNIRLAELSADDYTTTTDILNTRSNFEQKAYTWQPDIYGDLEVINEWDDSYAQVFTANVVLEGLEDIPVTDSNRDEWNDVKGIALHIRARAFYNLAQLFAPPYDPASASNDLGIPLRTSPDINLPVTRSSVEETYQRIITDLEEATALLRTTPEFIMDPSKPAAYGMLARCHLSMRQYEAALKNADKCLQIQDSLIDFNTLDASARFPIDRYNKEVIRHTEIFPFSLLFTYLYSSVDEALYNAYDDDDLRKTIFFTDAGDGKFAFRGSYTSGFSLFTGITTSEMYLIRAECLARTGSVDAALDNLNTLLEKRYVTGTFTPYETGDADEALDLILTERRKELLRRGLRWTDLRRLNFEPQHATTLTRTFDGVEYTLSPGDDAYVFPIPDYVIASSGIQQNER